MKPTREPHLLRTLLSALCLVECLLLVVLWMQMESETHQLLARMSAGQLARWFWHVQLPFWCLVAMLAVGAAAPWWRSRQFSLRTLIILYTLFAAGLGIIVLNT